MSDKPLPGVPSSQTIYVATKDGGTRMTPRDIRRRECIEDSRRRQAEGPQLPKYLRDPFIEQEKERVLREAADAKVREDPRLSSEYLQDQFCRLPTHIQEAIIRKERNEAAPKSFPEQAQVPPQPPIREIHWHCVCKCPSGISARPCCTRKSVKTSPDNSQKTAQLTRSLTQDSVSPQQPSDTHSTTRSVVHHEPVYSSPTTQVSIMPRDPVYRDPAQQASYVASGATPLDSAPSEKVNTTQEAEAPSTTDALPIWRPTIASKARERKKHE